ncbi:MAG: hypothetical protein OXU53_08655 [Deltaproteobacteria bacterium]|nr:hypothetical protein [Deltaproteobacteria bacterium]
MFSFNFINFPDFNLNRLNFGSAARSAYLFLIVGAVLATLFGLVTLSADQWLANQRAELGYKAVVEGNNHVEVKIPLPLPASGLNIRIEPAEQADPAAAPEALRSPSCLEALPEATSAASQCRGEEPETPSTARAPVPSNRGRCVSARGGPFSSFGVSVERNAGKEQATGTSRPAPVEPPAPRLDSPRGAAQIPCSDAEADPGRLDRARGAAQDSRQPRRQAEMRERLK